MQNKKNRFAIMALAFAISSIAHAAGQIHGVSVQKNGKGVEVFIDGDQLGDPIGIFSTNNTVYSLEVNATLSQKLEKLQVWQNGLQTIQTSTFKAIQGDENTRIQFKFGSSVKCEITKSKDGLSLKFSPQEVTLTTFLKQVETTATTSGAAAQPFALFADGFPSEKHAEKVGGHTKSVAKAAPTAAKAKHPSSMPVVSPGEPLKVGAAGQATVTDGKVSLDFVDTNITFILKALARQTGANIVTSPDVNGKLTVKLDNVSVREALTLVTSLSGLRFAQVGKTYVVTSNAKFLETLRSVQGPKEEATLSRVVPIYSGQGNQIKVAVLKSVATENAYGRFEMVLPSEKSMVATNQKVGATGKDGEDKDATQVSTMSSEGSKDTYMMLLGSPGRMDEVEQLVRSMDKQLCFALGVRIPENNQTIIENYNVHGGRAIDLMEAIAGKGKTTIGSVELFATPSNSIAKQTIVLKGREDEVRAVVRALEQLDSDEALLMKEFRLVELEFTDPRAMRELVVANVPGVSCVIAPNGVMNQSTYMMDMLRMQSEQRGTDQPAPQGGGTPLASGNMNGMQGGQGGMMGAQGGMMGGQQGQGMNNQIKDNSDTGLILPFENFEPNAFPMKLILRGTKEQVDAAAEVIRKTDVAPKQVSLEMRVMEISREELLRLGIDWRLFTAGAIKTINLNNAQTNPNNRIGVSVQGSDITGDVGATLDSISIGNRLVSRPNMICNDGRTNEVFVGDAIRYIESIQSTQNGVSVSTGTVRTGVRLAALPRIGGDGAINLDLRTAVIYLKGFKQVPQIGGELPQTSERTAQNTLSLRDGETFAIGGLIQEQDRKEMSGLPILKDLPLLGQFFRRTSTDRVKTELVIFVTARTVNVGKPKELPMAPDSAIIKDAKNFKPMTMPPIAGDTKKNGGKG